ncbi:hypothetical protein PINS_up004741 [Pythium insidiosum]|nr:hypothetical protein PINS_up004741 [Pythium insidiosum]
MTRVATGIVVLATALLSLQDVAASTTSSGGRVQVVSASPAPALPRRHAATPAVPSRHPVVAPRAHKTRAPTRPPVVGDEDEDYEDEDDNDDSSSSGSSGSHWMTSSSTHGSLSGRTHRPSSLQRPSSHDGSHDNEGSDSGSGSGSLSDIVGRHHRKPKRVRVDLSDLPSGHVTLPNGATGIDFSYEGGVVEFDVETARPAGLRDTWVQSAEQWLQHEVDNPEPMDIAVVCIVVVVIGLMLFALARQTTMDDLSERQTRRQSVERSAASTRQSEEDEEEDDDAASVSSSPSEAEPETEAETAAEDLEAAVTAVVSADDEEEVTEGSV